MARQYFFTGTAAPTTTPPFSGSTFVDTTNDRTYLATGTSSSADWKLVPNAISEILIDSDINFQGIYKIRNAMSMQYQPVAEITISGGVAVQTQTLQTVDTQADAATDDLDSLTLLTNSNVAILTLENTARVVTIKHGTGNFLLPNLADIVMKENVLYYFIHNGSDWQLMMDPQAVNTGTVNGWTAQQYFVEQGLTDAANISWNLNTQQTARVTLTDNRILDNPTNLKAGATYILRVIQDAGGTNTLTFGTAYKWPGGTAPTLTVTGDAIDLLTFYCDGTNMNGAATLDLK